MDTSDTLPAGDAARIPIDMRESTYSLLFVCVSFSLFSTRRFPYLIIDTWTFAQQHLRDKEAFAEYFST